VTNVFISSTDREALSVELLLAITASSFGVKGAALNAKVVRHKVINATDLKIDKCIINIL
jgi:hypothetical protein